jgi:hypothetical protein
MNKSCIIDSYTGAHAIGDGTLIDVTNAARRVGVRDTVAITHPVWRSCVEVVPGSEGEDQNDRLWNIISTLHDVMCDHVGAAEFFFSVHVHIDNLDPMPLLVDFKAVHGTDDNGRPCITIMEA